MLLVRSRAQAVLDLFMAGRFPFDELVEFYPLARINEAARDSERGVTLKPIVRFDDAAAA